MRSEKRFAVDAQEYPFTSHWLERDGVRMHYLDEGSGTPVLMVHGNPTWSYLYRNVIKALPRSVRAVAPDLPGFGFSGAPQGYGYTPREHADWLGELVQRLDLRGCVLVVQDWGGPIGLDVATRMPERFAGLVIAGTWCWKSDVGTLAFSRVMGSSLGKHLYVKKSFMTRKFMPMGIAHAQRRQPAALKPYEDALSTEEDRLATWLFARSLRLSSPWVEQVGQRLAVLRDRPIELVWPGRGWPGFYLKKWQSLFPHAKLTMLPNARHYVQEDEPEAIAAAIERIAARTSGTAASAA